VEAWLSTVPRTYLSRRKKNIVVVGRVDVWKMPS
jgi:hypothetical protein